GAFSDVELFRAVTAASLVPLRIASSRFDPSGVTYSTSFAPSLRTTLASSVSEAARRRPLSSRVFARLSTGAGSFGFDGVGVGVGVGVGEPLETWMTIDAVLSL